MIRIISLLLFSLIADKSMAQSVLFQQTVNKLYFGENFFDSSWNLIESLKNRSDLSYSPPRVYQSSITATMTMRSADALSSRHEFSFTKCPISDCVILSGTLVLTLGETATASRIIGKSWLLTFVNKKDADACFKKIQEMFKPISEHHNSFVDQEGYEVIEFSSNQNDEKPIDIAFYLGRNFVSKNYEIWLHNSNSFTK